MAAEDNTKVQAISIRRSNRDGQTSLPLAAAVAYPPYPGLKKAVLVVESCPVCSWPHRHEADWPAAALLTRRGRCGARYDLIPRVRRTKRRAA
ncbi:hypothetical protein [Streptosporangium sandarakinum]|uniref:hypothetical protein n=1 Tax=Streptosporangium sandarakinum TaxID=1260955 RepID=UPI00379285C9